MNQQIKKNKLLIRILTHPLTAIFAMGVGVLLGISNKPLSLYLGVYGEAYTILLKMTVLPILVSAIITSLGAYITNASMKKMMGKIIFLLVFFSFLYAFLGLTVGSISKIGALPEESRNIISEKINLQSEVLEIELYSVEDENLSSDKLVAFLSQLIPENIFYSLTNNQVLAVLIFSILFGFALGILPRKSEFQHSVLFDAFEEMYLIFSNIIKYIIIILPFGLICIIASEVAKSGFSIIQSSAKLIIVFYVLGMLLLFINTVLMSISLKRGLFSTLKYIAYPSIIAFSTRNSIASMAMAIDTLQTKFNLDKEFTKATMPLLTILGRFGNILYFSLIVMFSAQLYFIEVSIGMMLVLSVSVVLAGVATAGASGFATLSLIAIVMDTIGVPFDTILVILYVIDIVIDPLRTTLIVHTNTLITSLLHGSYIKANAKDQAKVNSSNL